MVTTRSQGTRNHKVENKNMDRKSDDESEGQRISDMNRHFGELTNLVLALAQQKSSNPREANGLSIVADNSKSIPTS